MDRRQVITVIVTILVFFVALAGAAYFGEPGPAKRGKGIKFKQGPKKAKTTVNEKMYEKLTGDEPAKPDAGGNSKKKASSGPVSGVIAVAPVISPEQLALNEAMNALTPQQGIDRLTALLTTLQQVEEASKIYSALGTLYAQTGEAGAAMADQAFQDAKTAANSQEDRDRATLGLVNSLAARGELDRAIAEAGAVLGVDKPVTAPGLELVIAQGKLLERKGDTASAEEEYKRGMDQALAAVPVLNEVALNAYRQSCLALVQLYRKTDREALANSLTINMKANLSRITPSRKAAS